MFRWFWQYLLEAYFGDEKNNVRRVPILSHHHFRNCPQTSAQPPPSGQAGRAQRGPEADGGMTHRWRISGALGFEICIKWESLNDETDQGWKATTFIKIKIWNQLSKCLLNTDQTAHTRWVVVRKCRTSSTAVVFVCFRIAEVHGTGVT